MDPNSELFERGKNEYKQTYTLVKKHPIPIFARRVKKFALNKMKKKKKNVN